MLLLLHLVVETNEHSVAPVYCMPAACLVLLMLGKMERLGKHQPVLPTSRSVCCITWGLLKKCCTFLFDGKIGVCLLFTSVILNVKPLRGFLVGFICPCFYFQFIMNSVFGKSLVFCTLILCYYYYYYALLI